METINSKDMRILDLNCEYFGLSRLQLMENAGKAVAEEIMRRFSGGRVAVYAGSGNNGGDGFVAARHLRGFDVEIFLAGEPKTEIAQKNFEILKKAGYKIQKVSESDAEIIVDALLGTGITGRPRGDYERAIEIINSSKAFRVAVDVPSGLNADTGEYEIAVKADLTVTFHKMKPGIIKARDICGEVVVRDIGIPEAFERICGVGDVVATYKRFEDAHKGMHGRVAVIGGGDYTGAVAFASLSAYHSGADIVITAVPESIKSIVAGFSPNLIVRGLKGEKITPRNLREAEEIVRKCDVAVIGMGVGENPEFKEFVEELLKSCRKAVLDAEGITGNIPEGVECILTPHRGELKKNFGAEPKDVQRVARETGAVILLKGKEDIITDGQRTKVNRTGNAGMTVGGTGDVLAGMCGALFCLDDAFHSACASAFVNGYAGDLCLEKYGYNFTSMHLIEMLPEAFRRCLSWK
ncbi:MAG: NAD(P)H-hydrate dehydratase [Archaeoglobales archaeon]|jgi:NAD(P)H-hydrate epimerase|nr:NAD(P)H-hydrate dehydratase [Archaeoglobi archaeon]NHW22647.1 NAD(P)H-hydrate dehydratase [Archaeoglobales archaeon]TDA30086.1 MAG: bifunctional ADP-dependent NAD(P)H-hydrate dehydratase/NAD(P)H-hydrate epimerase [Archaeoglobi archaeon]